MNRLNYCSTSEGESEGKRKVEKEAYLLYVISATKSFVLRCDSFWHSGHSCILFKPKKQMFFNWLLLQVLSLVQLINAKPRKVELGGCFFEFKTRLECYTRKKRHFKRDFSSFRLINCSYTLMKFFLQQLSYKKS